MKEYQKLQKECFDLIDDRLKSLEKKYKELNYHKVHEIIKKHGIKYALSFDEGSVVFMKYSRYDRCIYDKVVLGNEHFTAQELSKINSEISRLDMSLNEFMESEKTIMKNMLKSKKIAEICQAFEELQDYED